MIREDEDPIEYANKELDYLKYVADDMIDKVKKCSSEFINSLGLGLGLLVSSNNPMANP